MSLHNGQNDTPLRRGWTTGACASAAVKAALQALWSEHSPSHITITLPRGEIVTFKIEHYKSQPQTPSEPPWVEVGIIKDAGDDPDVTHGALIIARISPLERGAGVTFHAGDGVGTVTRPGLPLPVGAAAINPVPRDMMQHIVQEQALKYGQRPDVSITISIPNGQEIAKKTWNPRLGIEGGLSVLGTTGIVRPFSCAAWIASIHRGIDVARAQGATHICGCTGATSERIVQELHGLPDWAMIDMGDFIGGMLKYLRKNPIQTVTIGGGIGKLTKFAQGAVDLHSKRSQIDFDHLADMMQDSRIQHMRTALEVYDTFGSSFAQRIATLALKRLSQSYGHSMTFDVVIIARDGHIIARATQ